MYCLQMLLEIINFTFIVALICLDILWESLPSFSMVYGLQKLNSLIWLISCSISIVNSEMSPQKANSWLLLQRNSRCKITTKWILVPKRGTKTAEMAALQNWQDCNSQYSGGWYWLAVMNIFFSCPGCTVDKRSQLFQF